VRGEWPDGRCPARLRPAGPGRGQRPSAKRLEVLLVEAESELTRGQRAIADRVEGLARLHGQVAALRTRATAAEDEIGRLTAALDAARQRAATAQGEFAAVEVGGAGLDAGELDLDARFETAAAGLTEAEDRLTALQDEEREVERQRSAAAARRDALALGLARNDGHSALLAAADRLSGVLGSIAEVVRVEAGWEAAVAAALGAAADAVAVSSLADAAAALALLRAEEAGRAGLVVGGADYPPGGHLADAAGADRAPAMPSTRSPRRSRCGRRSSGCSTGSRSSRISTVPGRWLRRSRGWRPLLPTVTCSVSRGRWAARVTRPACSRSGPPSLTPRSSSAELAQPR